MLLYLLLLYFNLLSQPPANWQTPYEKSKGTQTATYPECIAYYQHLDVAYDEIKMVSYGTTDVGKPLHLVILSLDKDFDPISLRKKDKQIFLIQNGIHPGEPEGIDASMMLARDLMQQKDLRAQLKNVVVLFIPIYNVGGALNRNSSTRANQNGPESYGFRGNARNLDLNRDYIKTDSRNARTFTQIFQEWQPDVFVDTHTSNGADYQHTLTLLPTQKDKLHPQLSQYLTQQMLPALQSAMTKRHYPLTPYVDTKAEAPDSGLIGFMDAPRYSTGYTTLFNTIGFMTETHMLKSFAERVKATYVFLEIMVNTISRDGALIAAARQKAQAATLTQTQFPLNWTLDTTVVDKTFFRGYTARHKPSEVSGLPRLYYDRTAPWERNINYYQTYKPTQRIDKPKAYLVPQAWAEVIERLKLNGVQMRPIQQDTSLTAEVYYIADYKTNPRPYEGHYLHNQVSLRPEKQTAHFLKGDYLIYLNQAANRYIVETLEPQGGDSFFSWGFFDAILQQKEYFSDYVFEDLAADLLKKDANLRQQYEEWKKQNPEQAKSAHAHLQFIYLHSPYYETTHLRYPVVRLTN